MLDSECCLDSEREGCFWSSTLMISYVVFFNIALLLLSCITLFIGVHKWGLIVVLAITVSIRSKL